ncbi:MAG: hypothetical protein ACQET3_09545 [Promethearchaeati archaeon]
MSKIAVVLGRGGHTAQTFSLVDLLGERFEYVYLIGILDSLTPKKIRIDGLILPVFPPRLLPQDSRILSAVRTVLTLILSFFYLAVIRPVAAISCGTGMTIPVFLAARMLGIPTVFIESMSRVENLSITGKFLLNRTDLFMVQWPQLAQQLEGAIYGGQLL